MEQKCKYCPKCTKCALIDNRVKCLEGCPAGTFINEKGLCQDKTCPLGFYLSTVCK